MQLSLFPLHFALYRADHIQSQPLYRRIFFTGPYRTQFAAHLKERVLPIFLKAFSLSQDDLQAVYTLEFYIPGMISLVNCWLQSPQPMPLEQLAKLIEGLLKEGILAQL